MSLLCTTVTAVAGCAADPAPPRQETARAPAVNDDTGGTQIVVAIDTIGLGLNPHLIADQSPVTNAITAMTLPSPFRPITTPTGTAWIADQSLVVSADVTSQQPFTVTYRINQNAQWSDGSPVTADDFSYLWRQMTTQPGVISPAGYRLIADVASRSGGKDVAVRFTRPYPAWRELFYGLLPSHVLRGAPGGFQSGMDTGLPPSAGPFAINTIDRSRDEIRLVRNDRYWTTPAVVDKITLRRIADTAQLAESVRSGDTGAASLTADQAVQTQLSGIPGVVTGRQPDSRALGVTANVRSPDMADINVRRAIFGLIDPALLTAASAGGAVVTPFANPVFAPRDPGYYPMPSSGLSAEQIDGLLTEAGYRRVTGDAAAGGSGAAAASPGSPNGQSSVPTAATSTTTPAASTPAAELPAGVPRVERDGKPLQITVGAVAGDERSSAAAASLVDQLRRTGIEGSVAELPAARLYGSDLTGSGIDIVVGWSNTSLSPAVRLASAVACPTTTTQPPVPGGSASNVVPTGGSTPDGDGGADAASADTRFTGNVSGLCDPLLSQIADRALTDADPMRDLRAAEPLLSAQAVYLPLYQDDLLTLTGPKVVGVALSGPMPAGIFATAATWKVAQP